MTEREQQVYGMLEQRLTVKEMAARLGVPRSQAASIVLHVMNTYGDPRLAELDRHIAALGRINFVG